MNEIIVSNKNTKIKYIKSLYKKKNRWEEKKYIIEGIRSIEQILNSEENIIEIFYSNDVKKLSRGEKLLKKIEYRGIDLTEVSKDIFENISSTETPQYILALVSFKEYNAFEVLESKKRFIILDRIQDPGNLGTIIRTSEAMGFDGILAFKGTADIYNPKVVRSTMGIKIPIAYCEEIDQIIKELKRKKIKIVSTSLDSKKYIYEANLSGDIAIIIGNEANGVSKELIDNSDEILKIPMQGEAESLNAAIASGMIIYESVRQKART
ncbi:MAG: RNA methyltransferase [Andreesenia angusta]|nr:RNA methyltransferase [Andreesenia angusta]